MLLFSLCAANPFFASDPSLMLPALFPSQTAPHRTLTWTKSLTSVHLGNRKGNTGKTILSSCGNIYKLHIEKLGNNTLSVCSLLTAEEWKNFCWPWENNALQMWRGRPLKACICAWVWVCVYAYIYINAHVCLGEFRSCCFDILFKKWWS